MTEADFAAVRAALAKDEDDRAYPYDDATGKTLQPGDTLIGNLSAGIGRNLHARPLSPRVRQMMLDEDLQEALTDLRGKEFRWFSDLDLVRARAILEIRFALGPSRFRGFVRMLAAMATGAYELAARELVLSKAATSDWPPSRVTRWLRMLKFGQD